MRAWITVQLLLASVLFAASEVEVAEGKHIVHRHGSAPYAGQNDTKDEQDYAGPTRMFVIETEDDAWRVATEHATERKELIFTTFTFTHKRNYDANAINYAKHLWETLSRVKRMRNTIMITYDTHSCQVMWDNGIPCFLDRYLPQPYQLPGQYGSDVPHWYQKYAWALKFIKWGYIALFIEADQIFFKDPLPYYNPYNDLEGLSDWNRVAVPDALERFKNPCHVYHMQKFDNGQAYLDWGPWDPNIAGSAYHINPCMSTGFWFIQPTVPAQKFLEGFIDLILHWRDWQIDQVLWNEAIMAFLIGQGKSRPMHFSLLDQTYFSNFAIYDRRREMNMTVDPVMLHAGGIPGHIKENYMRENGHWLAESWNMSSGQWRVNELKALFNLTLPPEVRAELHWS